MTQKNNYLEKKTKQKQNKDTGRLIRNKAIRFPEKNSNQQKEKFMANTVILTGHLGADAAPHGNGEKTFARLRLATNESWPKGDGTYETRTDWHTVVVFSEPLAKSLLEKAKKGDHVYVQGKLRTNRYAKDGVERESSEILIDGSGRYEKLSSANSGPASDNQTGEAQAPADSATNEEIPF